MISIAIEPGVSVAAGVCVARGSSVAVEVGRSVGDKVDLRVGMGLALSGESSDRSRIVPKGSGRICGLDGESACADGRDGGLDNINWRPKIFLLGNGRADIFHNGCQCGMRHCRICREPQAQHTLKQRLPRHRARLLCGVPVFASGSVPEVGAAGAPAALPNGKPRPSGETRKMTCPTRRNCRTTRFRSPCRRRRGRRRSRDRPCCCCRSTRRRPSPASTSAEAPRAVGGLRPVVERVADRHVEHVHAVRERALHRREA